MKHGLYTYDTLRTEDLDQVHLESECPVFNPNTDLVSVVTAIGGSNVR